MDINFYNFKKSMNISSELDLSIPGIVLKPAPETTIEEQELVDGQQVTQNMDIDLGETKDERVNFLYDADSSFIDGTVTQFRFRGTEVTDLQDSNNEDLIKYPSGVISNINNQLVYPAATLTINGTNLPIRPAHQFMKDDTFPETSRKVLNDRLWLAACGFWGTQGYNLRKFIEYDNTTKSAILGSGNYIKPTSDNRAKPWISIKDFKNRLKELRTLLVPKGIDVIVTLLEKSLDVNGNDLNDSKISRRLDKNYSKVKVKSSNFINNNPPNGRNDLLQPLPPEQISPFDVSMQAIQLALGPDEDELFDELVNILNEVRDNYNTVKSNVVIKSGTVTSATVSTIVLDAGASSSDGEYTNYIIEITSGPGVAQKRSISSYTGSTRTAVISENWNLGIPTSLSQYRILRPSLSLVDSDTIQTQFPAIIKETRELANKLKYADMDTPSLVSNIEAQILFNEFKQSIRLLDATIKKIEWFEFFQGVSLRKSRTSILTGNTVLETANYRRMARILVPVDLGVKVRRVRKKGQNIYPSGLTSAASLASPVKALSFGFRALRRYRYIRTDLGVRFAEIKFVDSSVLTKFRKNEAVLLNNMAQAATQNTIQLSDNANDENGFYKDYSIEIIGGTGVGQIRKILDYSGNTKTATVDRWDVIPDSSSQFKIYRKYEETKPDPIPTDVTISYEMPHLPFDTELRKIAFDNLGFFDNSKNSNHENIYDDAGNILVNFDNSTVLNNNSFVPFYPGYQAFKDTSKDISAMRGGLDIYNKVQFLLAILQDTFSKNRVKLIETNRSLEDQNKVQFGGDSSTFLSWHNYGLAVKIVITDETEITPIKDGSSDFFKLLDVADAFTKLCYSGDLGTPINVVWCGRLKTGPDNFVWEFLPIGVNHKDVVKFRDSLFNQVDPIAANGFIDVVAANYIVPSSYTSNNPYIKENSEALKNAIKIGNSMWVSPSDIRNYSVPNNIVMKDIQEFLLLVKNKFLGNGNTLIGTKDVYQWKLNNPISYNQLITYHSILGNYNIVRSFMAIDYVDRFESLVISAGSLDNREFVRSFLGDISYNNLKINIRVNADSGYISPVDGKLYIKVTNIINNNPEGNGNTFGQQQLSPTNINIVDGGYIVSNEPVLTDVQIRVIHSLIKDQILNEYKLIKDSFENLDTDFLFDSVKNGSNAELFNTLENEFGIISTQDLIPLEQIRELFNRININKNPDSTSNPDGTIRGAGVNLEDPTGESVYEKLISTLESAEVQFVKPGNEKVIIEEILEKPLEVYIKAIMKKNGPEVQDIL